MGLEAIELSWLDLHLRRPHRTSYGTDVARPVVLVRVRGDGLEGWGECAAFAAPTYTEEYAAGAWAVTVDHLAPRLLAAGVGEAGPDRPDGWVAWAAEVADAVAGVVGHPMAKAALELAVVDARLRAGGWPLADALGVTAPSVEAGAVVGTRDTVDEVVAEVAALVEAGYGRVKLKIDRGWDLEPVRAVRDAFGSLRLQVDANGAYGGEDAAHLAGLDRFGLLCLEQPCPADDLAGSAAVAARLDTPVCLDESITSPARLEICLALGAGDMVCLKPGRVGGLGPALAIHDRCLEAGVPLWCGGMLETGLARAANAALAGLPGMALPGDLGGGDRFEEGDPAGALAVTDGRVAVWRGPGVGPVPDPDRLAVVTTARATVTA